MTRKTDKFVEAFETAVIKRALASNDGAFSPHDREIAEILYRDAKEALLARIRQKDKLISILTRSSH